MKQGMKGVLVFGGWWKSRNANETLLLTVHWERRFQPCYWKVTQLLKELSFVWSIICPGNWKSQHQSHKPDSVGRTVYLPLHLQKESNTDLRLAWPEGGQPLWRAKVLRSSRRAQEKGPPREAKCYETERTIRGRIFHWHPFVFRLPVNMPQHSR